MGMRLGAFQNNQDLHWEEAGLPSGTKENLKRIIVALCELDPSRRLAVADLEQDEWLMSGGTGSWRYAWTRGLGHPPSFQGRGGTQGLDQLADQMQQMSLQESPIVAPFR